MQVLNSTLWAHMLVQCSSLDSRHTKRSVQVTATEASARGGGDVAIHQGRTEKTAQKDSKRFKKTQTDSNSISGGLCYDAPWLQDQGKIYYQAADSESPNRLPQSSPGVCGAGALQT